MNVIPLKSAELGRWRLAIRAAVLQLSFAVDRSGDQPQLRVQLRGGGDGGYGLESIVGRALIELDKQLETDFVDHRTDPNAISVVAVVFRARLLGLMSGTVVPVGTGRAVVEPINAGLAYAEVLGAVLKAILESDGPDAVRALMDASPERGDSVRRDR
jgi:hypothetical protein